MHNPKENELVESFKIVQLLRETAHITTFIFKEDIGMEHLQKKDVNCLMKCSGEKDSRFVILLEYENLRSACAVLYFTFYFPCYTATLIFSY